MRTTRRSHITLAALGCAATLLVCAPTPVVAAPYTDDAVLTVSTTNPVIGGTLTITVLNFASGELVDVTIDPGGTLLTTLTADQNGTATGSVTLPPNLRCAHVLTARGRTSGEVAQSALIIGPANACANSGAGNVGSGNVGSGNVGDGNVGSGNVGDYNTGNGNVGDHNGSGSIAGAGGSGTDPYTADDVGRSGTNAGAADFGPVGQISPAAPAPNTDGASTATAALVLGLAAVGGIGFVRQRRQPS